MSVSSSSRIIRQTSIYGLLVVTNVALTLGLLKVFPQLLPDNRLQVAPHTLVLPDNKQHPNFVTAAVNKVGEAVVRSDIERTVKTNVEIPFFANPFFRDFFGESILPRIPKEYQQLEQGSGFIIDSNGIILTNAHVVSGAEEVIVTLKDGRTFQGVIQGIDEPSDLAVVKIRGKNLPFTSLGDSSQLQVGDWAIAVGNPLGLDNTVTFGIISSLNRSSFEIGIPDTRLDFIQTDTSINPGNSGGPLLNRKGEVIGINTAILADAEGIGFAIPINKAKAIKDQLARGENIPHPYIGIRMLSLTPEIAQQLNQPPNYFGRVPQIKGILVVQVVPDSPAAVAGLLRGDVITLIKGTEIETAEQLQNLVEESQIGKPLTMTIRRGEQTLELSVTPQELQKKTN